MEKFVFVVVIAAIAFWLGRQTKHASFPSDRRFLQSADETGSDTSGQITTPIPMNGRRAFTLVFTLGWIIAWTAGIGMASMMFLSSLGSGFATIFIGGWLIAAVAGWFYAASVIYRLVTGRSIQSRGGQYF